METVEHLRGLFRYNEWANRRVLESLKTSNCERARQIFAHLLTTEHEYFERFAGKDSTGFDFWPDLTLDECGKLNTEVADRYATLIDGSTENDLDRRTQYKNSRGEPYEDTIRDLLTHVLLHSSIHRGNIVIKMRESGFEPPMTDYIIYLREQDKR